MTRSNMIFYLVVSMMIHVGMLVLLRNYRLTGMEEPEKTVQVEVEAIREVPMISTESPLSAPVAESFRFPPDAVAETGSDEGKVKQPEFIPASPSPSLDFRGAMDTVSHYKTPSPEAMSIRPVAADWTRGEKPNKVKQPAPLSASFSPTVDFPHAMAAVSTAKKHFPVTVPSPSNTGIGESVVLFSTAEPVAFENQVAVEMEITNGDMKTASAGRQKVDPRSTPVAALASTRSFETAAIETPGTISGSGTELPEIRIHTVSDIGASAKGLAATSLSPNQARPSGHLRPAITSLDFTVSSHFPGAPVFLPQTGAPVFHEPPARPPEFYFPGSKRGAAFLLLVDTSGSVRGDPLEGLKRSARAFVELMGKNDRAAIMTFDDKVRSFAGFTSEKEFLNSKIEKLRARGQRTLLFDGLVEAAANIRKEDRLNRHVFLFSDGKDEGSQADLAEVLQALVESNISVFAVGFTRVEKQYLDVLRQLAEKTGGIFVRTPEFREMLALYKSTGPPPEMASEDEENIVYLMVTSNPSDARIVIDGKFRGNTPLTLSVPAGKHEIVIDKDGFFAWEAQLHLEQGRRKISPSLLSKDNDR